MNSDDIVWLVLGVPPLIVLVLIISVLAILICNVSENNNNEDLPLLSTKN